MNELLWLARIFVLISFINTVMMAAGIFSHHIANFVAQYSNALKVRDAQIESLQKQVAYLSELQMESDLKPVQPKAN